jgi:anti-sigma-K factor RskA
VNVKEYIESGILEAYVLGALSATERAEVEANIALYPELADEVSAIEESMQSYAEEHAVEPPAFMQDKIWNAIQGQQEAPIAPKVIPLTAPVQRSIGWARAAVWLLLAGSILVNVMLWSQRNNNQQQQLALQQRMDSLQSQQQQLAQTINHYNKLNDMTADPGMQTIVMHTLKEGHPMAATVYWSKAKGDAYVAVEKLPMPPQGMQYQMWVIQNGKPVSMGMLPNDMMQNAKMQKLPMQVSDGQAFAISLEKEGGSPVPTAENIYVMGKVNS